MEQEDVGADSEAPEQGDEGAGYQTERESDDKAPGDAEAVPPKKH